MEIKCGQLHVHNKRPTGLHPVDGHLPDRINLGLCLTTVADTYLVLFFFWN